jgi:hypothetical protein
MRSPSSVRAFEGLKLWVGEDGLWRFAPSTGSSQNTNKKIQTNPTVTFCKPELLDLEITRHNAGHDCRETCAGEEKFSLHRKLRLNCFYVMVGTLFRREDYFWISRASRIPNDFINDPLPFTKCFLPCQRFYFGHDNASVTS